MVDKKITIMVLKVDLQCRRCYNKVKKVLCKFPQIQDQVYDEKQNTVTIKVVCCCPEKIKMKIICKGGEAIKDIKIVEPKEKNPEKKPDDKDTEKNKQSQKPPDHDQKQQGNKPPKEKNTGKPNNEDGKRPHSPAHCVPEWYCPPPPCRERPVRTCCEECYRGRGGGPCWRGQQPPWPFGQPYYDGYCGARPVCYGEYYVVQYECHRENYGTCRIM